MMKPVLLWALLGVLLGALLLSPGHCHSLARPSESDLEQIKSLLQRFEASLSETAPEADSEADYEANPDLQRSSGSRSWGQEESPAQSSSQRSRLQDLLLTARRSSGCFGARMDRIGNASGLGCGRG